MARENSGWGYTRIRGVLSNLGHDVGRNTIKRILLEAGMDPAPERYKCTSWSAFLRAHWGAIAVPDNPPNPVKCTPKAKSCACCPLASPAVSCEEARTVASSRER